jgi:peptide deformylase
MKLVTDNDPILKDRMPEFDFEQPSLDPIQLEKDLIDFMFANKAIGLSANQVGIRARVFVMGHSSKPELAQAFFNPVIEKHTDKFYDLEEGCLSFPGIYVKIKRPATIQVRYQNSLGESKTEIFTDVNAKCFLHEFDHLEGITFKGRVSQLKWSLAVKKSKPKRKFK